MTEQESESSLTNDPDPNAPIRSASEYHTPVMLPEVLEFLDMKPNAVYVDATLGGGGYTEAMLRASKKSQVFGFDTDPAAVTFATNRLKPFGDRFQLIAENFARLRESMAERGIAKFEGIVYDLGVSSHQLDTSSIGLSYRVESPLDMRLDPRLPLSAHAVVNTYDAAELKRIFQRYGEEPYSGPIARSIVAAREIHEIQTTTELAGIVTKGVREDKRNSTLSRVFQALRIEVNQELASLERSLRQAIDMLRVGGRIVVVSYHSLEDRIVKEIFKEESSPIAEAGTLKSLKETIDRERVRLTLLHRKAVTPSAEEVETNVRARSAKLRAAEKTAIRD